MASAGLEKVLREVASLSESEQRKLREVLNQRLAVKASAEDVLQQTTMDNGGHKPPPYKDPIALFIGGSDDPWVRPTVQGLARLVTLGPNWDSYGAPPIDVSRIQAAVDLLRAIMRPETPAPAVLATSSGGLQFEWHENGVDLEIEAGASRDFHVSFEDHHRGEVWEGDVSTDTNGVARCIAWLSDSNESRDR
ncbi:MAG TPA: hypothetical protein VMV69_30070 [Pirellulales bacterium]|nr:hypothetical protein [Pirellulales bacterium]